MIINQGTTPRDGYKLFKPFPKSFFPLLCSPTISLFEATKLVRDMIKERTSHSRCALEPAYQVQSISRILIQGPTPHLQHSAFELQLPKFRQTDLPQTQGKRFPPTYSIPLSLCTYPSSGRQQTRSTFRAPFHSSHKGGTEGKKEVRI